MPYVTQAEIQTAIPAEYLNDALADDRSGTPIEGLLADIIAAASLEVDKFLGGRYRVPFAEPPAAVRVAALTFAMERVFARRQIAANNPWKERADAERARLEKIGKGELPLDATLDADQGSDWGSQPLAKSRFTS